jgi:hypothetical protein
MLVSYWAFFLSSFNFGGDDLGPFGAGDRRDLLEDNCTNLDIISRTFKLI